MRVCARDMALAGLCVLAFAAPSVAGGGDLPRVTISQVCGSGGLNSSAPNYDFVELHNAGSGAADLSGWTLQLSLGTSAAWRVIPLAGLAIPPGGYALIQCEAPLQVGQAPSLAPDLAAPVGTSPLLSHTGKVALLESAAPLSVPDPRALSTLRDFVGYGGAGPAEGTRAPSPGAGPPARVLVRRCGGRVDAGDNLTDFVLLPYAPGLPRSSASPTWVASPDILDTGATPTRAALGEPVLLTARIDGCGSPPVSASVDLTGLGGPASFPLRDDGTGGDLASGDGVYSALLAGSAGASGEPLPPGVWNLPVAVAAQAGGRSAAGTVRVVVLPADQTGMKISQVYAGGGVDAGAFHADYVEIHNAGIDAIDLLGSTLLVAGPVGSTWTRVPLSGIVPAGAYVLVQLGPASPVGQPLPTPDILAPQSLLLSSGCKVALVADPVPSATPCPTAADRLIDLVGAGGADCREGADASANAPWPGLVHRAIFRACEGGRDTDSNVSDWAEGTPLPRNLSAARASGVTVPNVTSDTPGLLVAGQSTVIRAQVVDCVGAGFDQVAVSVDASAVGGPAALPARDDGLDPDQTAGDGWYAATVVIGPGATPGVAAIRVIAQTPGPRTAEGDVRVTIGLPPLGACCVGAACETLGQAACAERGGTWLGGGVPCTPLSPLISAFPYAGIPALPNPIFDSTNDRYDFTIAGSGLVVGPGGLRLALHLQHTWVGDLTIELSNVNSHETVIARVGRPASGEGAGAPANLDGWYTFHELARQSIWEAAAAAGTGPQALVPPGEYRTAGPGSDAALLPGLKAFAGQPIDGAWTLRIRDDGIGDTGFLLGLTLGDNAVTNPCCPADWNADGLLDPDDLADLIACFFSGGCPRGDVDGNGQIDPDDLADGIGLFFLGCP